MNKDIKEDSQKYKFSKLDCLLLVIILITAFFVRVYKISDQSVTFDEYVVIGNFKVCNLTDFISIFYINAPDLGISPLSAIILYYWLNIFDDYEWLWRLLPITFGLMTITTVYLFAKDIGGRKSAFLASLLFCLSPFSIWFHQELRCYAFLQFLSILSLYALFQYIYSDCKKELWYILGTVSNLVIPWFHAVYSLFPIIQIIVLILNNKFEKKTFLWSVQCIGSTSIWTFWFLKLSPFIYNTVNPAHVRARFRDIVIRIFGNESVGISEELLPEWKTSITTLENYFSNIFVKYLYVIDYYIIFLIFFLSILFIWYCYKERKKEHYYLLVSIIIPITLFLVLEFIVIRKPIFHPMYFFYIFPLMYISFSVVLLNLRMRIFSNFLIVTLLFSYAIQCFSLISYKNRTDYKYAIKYIEENAGINDIVLGQRSTSMWDVGKIYQKRKDLGYETFYTLHGLTKKVKNILLSKSNVWIIIEPYTLQILYQDSIIKLLDEFFLKRGIDVNWEVFPGEYNLLVGQVFKDNNVQTNENNEDSKNILVKNDFVDYDKLIASIEPLYDNGKKNELYMDILKEYIPMWPLLPWVNIYIISEWIVNGEYRLAESMSDYLINKYPKFSDMYFLKGIVCLRTDREDIGKMYIQKAEMKNKFLKRFIKSKCRPQMGSELTGKYDSCKKEIKRIKNEGLMPLSPIFEILLQMEK